MADIVVDSQTGEIVEEKAIVPAPKTGFEGIVKTDADKGLLHVIQDVKSLNWRELTPPQLAVLIMQKPFVAQGGGQMYLSFKQAIIFATRCFELGVSPFSSEVWFDPNKATVNLTLEGKKQVARNKGIDLGPPKFEEISREWDALPRMTENVDALKKAGFRKDAGVKCAIRVGDPKNQEHVEYIAWLSEWYVERSPVWKSKPLHMLQTRACEKAISMALGTGASDPLTDD
jgi:hypothetical protein